MECLNKKLEIFSIFRFITQFNLLNESDSAEEKSPKKLNISFTRVYQPKVKKYLTFSRIDVIQICQM